MYNITDAIEIIDQANTLFRDPLQDALNFDEYAEYSDACGVSDIERIVAAIMPAAISTIVGHGFADDQAGDTDTIGHYSRVGNWIMATDSHGFRTCSEYQSEDEACRAMDEIHEACNPETEEMI